MQILQHFLLASILMVITEARVGDRSSIINEVEDTERELVNWWFSPTVSPTVSPTLSPTKAPHVQYHGRNYNISDYYHDDAIADYTEMEEELKYELSLKNMSFWTGSDWLWFVSLITGAGVVLSIGIVALMQRRDPEITNDKLIDDESTDGEYSTDGGETSDGEGDYIAPGLEGSQSEETFE